MLDLIVYIGRFQPPHKAHIETIERALRISERVKVFLGSALEPRTPKNPWTFTERWDMIYGSLDTESRKRVFYTPLPDRPGDNEAWANEVQTNAGDFENIGIIGHKKDESSFYLDLFPEWELVEIENIDGLNATDIREKYFNLPDLDMSWADDLPYGGVKYLKEFRGTNKFMEVFNQIHYDKAHYS